MLKSRYIEDSSSSESEDSLYVPQFNPRRLNLLPNLRKSLVYKCFDFEAFNQQDELKEVSNKVQHNDKRFSEKHENTSKSTISGEDALGSPVILKSPPNLRKSLVINCSQTLTKENENKSLEKFTDTFKSTGKDPLISSTPFHKVLRANRKSIGLSPISKDIVNGQLQEKGRTVKEDNSKEKSVIQKRTYTFEEQHNNSIKTHRNTQFPTQSLSLAQFGSTSKLAISYKNESTEVKSREEINQVLESGIFIPRLVANKENIDQFSHNQQNTSKNLSCSVVEQQRSKSHTQTLIKSISNSSRTKRTYRTGNKLGGTKVNVNNQSTSTNSKNTSGNINNHEEVKSNIKDTDTKTQTSAIKCISQDEEINEVKSTDISVHKRSLSKSFNRDKVEEITSVEKSRINNNKGNGSHYSVKLQKGKALTSKTDSNKQHKNNRKEINTRASLNKNENDIDVRNGQFDVLANRTKIRTRKKSDNYNNDKISRNSVSVEKANEIYPSNLLSNTFHGGNTHMTKEDINKKNNAIKKGNTTRGRNLKINDSKNIVDHNQSELLTDNLKSNQYNKSDNCNIDNSNIETVASIDVNVDNSKCDAGNSQLITDNLDIKERHDSKDNVNKKNIYNQKDINTRGRGRKIKDNVNKDEHDQFEILAGNLNNRRISKHESINIDNKNREDMVSVREVNENNHQENYVDHPNLITNTSSRDKRLIIDKDTNKKTNDKKEIRSGGYEPKINNENTLSKTPTTGAEQKSGIRKSNKDKEDGNVAKNQSTLRNTNLQDDGFSNNHININIKYDIYKSNVTPNKRQNNESLDALTNFKKIPKVIISSQDILSVANHVFNNLPLKDNSLVENKVSKNSLRINKANNKTIREKSSIINGKKRKIRGTYEFQKLSTVIITTEDTKTQIYQVQLPSLDTHMHTTGLENSATTSCRRTTRERRIRVYCNGEAKYEKAQTVFEKFNNLSSNEKSTNKHNITFIQKPNKQPRIKVKKQINVKSKNKGTDSPMIDNDGFKMPQPIPRGRPENSSKSVIKNKGNSKLKTSSTQQSPEVIGGNQTSNETLQERLDTETNLTTNIEIETEHHVEDVPHTGISADSSKIARSSYVPAVNLQNNLQYKLSTELADARTTVTSLANMGKVGRKSKKFDALHSSTAQLVLKSNNDPFTATTTSKLMFYVIQGEGMVEFNDMQVTILPKNYFHLDAGRPYMIKNTNLKDDLRINYWRVDN